MLSYYNCPLTSLIKRSFGPSPFMYLPNNDPVGRTAYEETYQKVALELLDNLGFETAGGGGADIWSGWIETVGDGALSDEGTLVHGGSHAAKITSGPSANTFIQGAPTPPNDGSIAVRPGVICTLTFWTRGDGVNAGRYSVYDNNNATWIVTAISTGVVGVSYTQVARTFAIPVGCYSINVNLLGPTANGGICYFDDVSFTASDFSLDGVYAASGVTYGQPGIGDGNLGIALDGNDSHVLIGSRAFNTLWNGDKFSALVWAKVDGATRWTDSTMFRYLFHIKSRTDANWQVAFGKSQTDHQLTWMRRVGGSTNEQTFTLPAGPLVRWFCQGFTVDVSIPRMRGYLYVPGVLDWAKVFDVAGDGIAWGNHPVDDDNALLFAGSTTTEEWIGSGGHAAYLPGVMLSDAKMRSAMVPGLWGSPLGGVDGIRLLSESFTTEIEAGLEALSPVISISPATLVSYHPLWNTNGVIAKNYTSHVGLRDGYIKGAIYDGAVGEDGGAVRHWIPANSPVVDCLTPSYISGFSTQEGSVNLLLKVTGASVWTNGLTQVIWTAQVNGNNIIRIRKLNANNTLDAQFYGNAVLDSVTHTTSSLAWLHVAITWSIPNDRFRMYIDRVQTGIDQTTLGAMSAGPITIACIGANTVTGANPFDGYIQHVRVDDAELSPGEISDIGAAMLAVAGRSVSNGQVAVNAANPLTTTTYDGSGEATHPDVYYNANKWPDASGSKYWMVMTPLPGAANTFENPSVLVSADGDNWSVPAGLTNPAVPDLPGGDYNSDPDLIVTDDNIMHIMYRAVVSSVETLRESNSANGIAWSAPANILTGGGATIVSPAIVKIGSTFYMWVVDESTTPFSVKLRTSDSLTSGWSAAQVVTLNGLPSEYEPYHVDVLSDTRLHMVLNARHRYAPTTPSAQVRVLVYGVGDIATQFSITKLVLEPQVTKWDSEFIYRTGGLRTAVGMDVWYGAKSVANAWRIGRSSFVI